MKVKFKTLLRPIKNMTKIHTFSLNHLTKILINHNGYSWKIQSIYLFCFMICMKHARVSGNTVSTDILTFPFTIMSPLV